MLLVILALLLGWDNISLWHAWNLGQNQDLALLQRASLLNLVLETELWLNATPFLCLCERS